MRLSGSGRTSPRGCARRRGRPRRVPARATRPRLSTPRAVPRCADRRFPAPRAIRHRLAAAACAWPHPVLPALAGRLPSERERRGTGRKSRRARASRGDDRFGSCLGPFEFFSKLWHADCLKQTPNPVESVRFERRVACLTRRYPDDHAETRTREQHAVAIAYIGAFRIATHLIPATAAKLAVLPAARGGWRQIAAPAQSHPIELEPLAFELRRRHLESMARTNVRGRHQEPLLERVIQPEGTGAFQAIGTKTLILRCSDQACSLTTARFTPGSQPRLGDFEITSEMERELPAIRHERPCVFGIEEEHRIAPLRQPLSAKASHADTEVRQWLGAELDARGNAISEQAMSGYAGTSGDDLGRGDDSPIGPNGDGSPPFLQSCLTEEDLLSAADESNDHGPSIQSIHHVEEFGSLRTVHPLLALHLLAIPCTLGLVEDDDVLVWQSRGMLAVIAQELVDVLDEGRDFMGAVLAPTPGTLLAQHQSLSHDL